MDNQYINIAKSSENSKEFEYFKTYIFPVTMKLEGGDKLRKVSGDSGGWTLYGIAYNKNKDLFSSFYDFADTTYEEACAIAFVRYYLPFKFQYFPRHIKLDIFDMAYNVGVVQTIKLFQREFSVLQDGILGPITLDKMINATPEQILNIRSSFYYRLVKAKNSLGKFIKGWLNRTNYIFKVKE